MSHTGGERSSSASLSCMRSLLAALPLTLALLVALPLPRSIWAATASDT